MHILYQEIGCTDVYGPYMGTRRPDPLLSLTWCYWAVVWLVFLHAAALGIKHRLAGHPYCPCIFRGGAEGLGTECDSIL
eukprot:671565-Pelagomonas_calceolata.AAC.1